MEFFDIRKMPVSLWRNGAGETREICCFPPAMRDFSGGPVLPPSPVTANFPRSRASTG